MHFGGKGHFFLSTERSQAEDYALGYINTSVMLGANYEAEYDGLMVMPTDDFFTFEDLEESERGVKVRYGMTSCGLKITENLQFLEGVNAIRQTTVAENLGKESVRLAKLAAATVTGIGLGGKKWHEDDSRFLVHICQNRWQGEAQWQAKTLGELGLYPASRHVWEKFTYRIQSVGGWSTNEYYPLLIIEDKERGETWFFEREGAENWFIELFAFGGKNSQYLCVTLGGGDEAVHWTYDLPEGERYETTAAVYGVVKGGFEEAVAALNAYKRKTSLADLPKIPVTFNDYMNCNWAIETGERLLPLIDKAAELGVECFCIDDGWAAQGEWLPLDEQFPTLKFQGIIDYIRAKGMLAGVWFEFERTTFAEAKKWGAKVLERNGQAVAHHRPRLDMRDENARKALLDRIDAMYRMGVRYIKNDHNNDERIGTNYVGESAGEGTRRNTLALYAFVDGLRAKYPDLVIENCGAGGMREDWGTLRHFHLQSTSDQEDYRLYPSIIVGAAAFLPPEKAGIWAYPYPLLFDDREEVEPPKAQLEGHKDGRETVFNMVNAMCGFMYLSGKIHLADEKNTRLMQEAVQTYKGYKDTIKDRSVLFPLPMRRFADKSFHAYGLRGKEDTLLFLWALEEKAFTLDLQKYGFTSAEKSYPLCEDNVAFSWKDGVLSVRFEAEYSACILKMR